MNIRHAQAIKKFLEARDAQKARESRVYNYYSTADADIDEAVTYSLNSAKAYLNYFLSQGIDIHGKNILEIGPGTNFGAMFLLQALGASQVAVADRFLVEYDAAFHPVFYTKLLSKAGEDFPGAQMEILEKAVQNRSHDQENFASYKCGLEDMAPIPDSSFDIVVSNAVLEHLEDPAPAFAELARVTKRGGYGFHQVDFRNHNDFSRPLEFLLMPEAEQNSFIMSRDYSCGNGWRASEYKTLFERNSFSVKAIQPTMLAEEEYFSEFMPRLKDSGTRYAEFAEEDLRIISAHFTVKKI